MMSGPAPLERLRHRGRIETVSLADLDSIAQIGRPGRPEALRFATKTV